MSQGRGRRGVGHELFPHRVGVLQACREWFPLLVEIGRHFSQPGQRSKGGVDVLIGPGQVGVGALDVGGDHAYPSVDVDATKYARGGCGVGEERQQGGFTTVEAGDGLIDGWMAYFDEGMRAISGDDSRCHARAVPWVWT